jgi:hypothetical protein
MGRARTSLLCAVAALLVSLVAAPLAHASAFDRIFRAYQQHGKISPCAFSDAQLQQALGQVHNDIEAYAPDFPDALQAAAEQRASGGCGKTAPAAAAPGVPAATPPAGSPPAAGTPAPATTTGTPAPPGDPQPAAPAADDAISRAAATTRDSDAGAPAPVVALGVIGALLLLGGLGYGLSRWLAWEPRWATRMRHATGEAGWRASATWAEFTDWVRLGR